MLRSSPVPTRPSSSLLTSAARHMSMVGNAAAAASGLVLRVFYKELSPENQKKLFTRAYWGELVKRSHRGVKLTAAVAVASAVYLFRCHDVTPITNRHRFIFTPHKRIAELAAQLETTLIDVYRDQIVTEEDDRWATTGNRLDPLLEKVIAAMTRDRRVRAVLKRLNLEFSLIVIDDEEPRLFVIPSGTVVLFTGFLDTVDDDDALAAMLAHEISHALLSHRAEELSWRGLVDSVVTPVMWALGFATAGLTLAPVMSAASEKAASSLLPPAYRRELEKEADVIGLIVAARACFDPRAAVNEWQRLATEFPDDRGAIHQLTDTHPDHALRSRLLEDWLSQALAERDDCGCRPLGAP